MIRNLLICVILLISGCAIQPASPPEPPKAIELKASAIEIQNFIEKNIRENPDNVMSILNADDRSITFRSECTKMPTMSTLKCFGIMLSVGNSGWDGPFLHLTYRTNEIKGTTTVTAQSQWCAINAVGKVNCRQINANKDLNEMLDRLKAKFESTYN